MKENLVTLKADALSKLSAFLDSLDPKRAQILSYWIRDYVRFLEKEDTFDPQKLIRYKRGSVVKAHLGYRIGSEEGGLHYAVVIDAQNAIKSQTVTVVPLTSVKPTTDLSRLHPSRLYIGDEIYKSLNVKLESTIHDTECIHQMLKDKLSTLEADLLELKGTSTDIKTKIATLRVSIDVLRKEIEAWEKKKQNARKMEDEISRMKRGSIALVSQITTISKIRIYDPLYPSDSLSNIRISDNALDKIDDKIISLFTKSK